MSMACTLYYLICAEQADEKVRKVRGTLTVDHLRVSWNKPSTPLLSFVSKLLRPRFMRYPPRALRIPRPKASSYKEPIHAWLYFNGPLSALKQHTKVVLDIPGGGFVAMTPRDHEDKLQAWAGKSGLPILALDYKKAPEFPYPYALNECYDAYHTIISSRGRCMGLSGKVVPQIVVSGDSAGGNLAVGMTLMILQAGSTDTRRFLGEESLPPPDGVVLVYPALDVNISSWMTDDQMALIQDRRARKTNQIVLRRKSDDYRKLAKTPHASDDDMFKDDEWLEMVTRRHHAEGNGSIHESPTAIRITDQVQRNGSVLPNGVHNPSITPTTPGTPVDPAAQTAAVQAGKPQILRTRLAMSSMISYFNDRILSPEMMRAMVILYIGPHNRPDLSTDFLLSPLLAPESLLAAFPKTCILTGERDPLVDDTVIFAGRLRQAKHAAWVERKEMGLLSRKEEKLGFREDKAVEVTLIPGISHGFLQFVSIFPEAWAYIHRCSRWMEELFQQADVSALEAEQEANREPRRGESTDLDELISPKTVMKGPGTTMQGAFGNGERHHRRKGTASSADEDRPLEMSIIRPLTKGRRKSSVSKGSTSTITNGQEKDTETTSRRMSNGRVEKGKKPSIKKNKSLVRLASSDDLLGRRMMALAGGLTGTTNGDDGPPTP